MASGTPKPMTFKTPKPVFAEPSEFTDVTLLVGKKRLYTSKYVLSQLSPVFRAMFTVNFKEKFCSEVKLPGKKYDDVLEFLLHIQPSSRRELTADLAIRLYPLFHEYQMDAEKTRCIDTIQKKFNGEISQNDLMSSAVHRDCVKLACTYDLPEVYELMVDVAIDHPATHYDALLDNMEETPMAFLKTFTTKLKRTAYDHRNGRPFRKRFERPCHEYTDPSKCVDRCFGGFSFGNKMAHDISGY